MICIIKPAQGVHQKPIDSLAGWIIASDIDDARRQAHGAFDNELSAALYRMTFAPAAGKYELPTGHILLVS